MKAFIFAILFFSNCVSGAEQPPKVRYDIWHVVEGYRLGFISDFGQQGINELWNYEGELNLGTATGMGAIYDRPCLDLQEQEASAIENQAQSESFLQSAKQQCFLTEEPWPFSATNDQLLKEWKGLKVVPVLVYYEHPVWTPFQYFTKTKDYALAIFPIDPNYPIAKKYTLDRSLYLGSITSQERRTIDGRIVKATLEHPIRKTYEIIVQEGLTGNSFLAMSVDDDRMFDYIVQAMLTGKLLKIEYVKFWDWEGYVPSEIFNYNTNYRIVSVEMTDVYYPLPGRPPQINP